MMPKKKKKILPHIKRFLNLLKLHFFKRAESHFLKSP